MIEKKAFDTQKLIGRLEDELAAMEELLAEPAPSIPALRRHAAGMRRALHARSAVAESDAVLHTFPMDLRAFFERVAAASRTRCTAAGLGFRAELHADGVFICDEERLRLILQELLEGAGASTGGDLLLRTEMEGRTLVCRLTVSPLTRPLDAGFAQPVAEAMGGSLEVSDGFTLRLPLEADPEGTLPELRGLRLLIVDDNALSRTLARELCEEAGAEVEEADDGETAVDMVSNYYAGYYDLVLMDIRMTGMDGYRAAELIREVPWATKKVLPIIALSALDYETDRSAETGNAINAFCKKPLDLNRVLYAYRAARNGA